MLSTDQHLDVNMSDIFFRQLGIPRRDIQLDIHGGSNGEMAGRMLIEIEATPQKSVCSVVDSEKLYGGGEASQRIVNALLTEIDQ